MKGRRHKKGEEGRKEGRREGRKGGREERKEREVSSTFLELYWLNTSLFKSENTFSVPRFSY